MNSRKLAGASAASVGAATAVAALLLGTLSGNAGEDPGGDPRASAYGISSEGLIPIAPTPYVEAPPDAHKELLGLPKPLEVKLLKVEAEAFRSKATAVDVHLLDAIKAKLIEARCDHGEGEVSIIGGIGGDGKVLPESPHGGQELDLSPLLKVEFNRQHKDHDTLTVDALVISLLPVDHATKAVTPKDLAGLQGLVPKLKVPTMEQLQAARAKSAPQQPSSAPTVADLQKELQTLNPNLAPKGDGKALLEVVVSSATCSEEHKEKHGEEHKEAPAPAPVEEHLPVTH